MKQFLNPYSYSLKKNPLQSIDREPVFRYGEYAIYKMFDTFYTYVWRNIIIAERTGQNNNIIIDLSDGVLPLDSVRVYFDHDRPKQAILDGIKIAKEIGFTIR